MLNRGTGAGIEAFGRGFLEGSSEWKNGLWELKTFRGVR